MIGGKRWVIKKIFRDYAVPLFTSVLLLLVLLLLILARYADLRSVKDVSKINPLITSGQNELVAVKDENGKTKIIQEDKTTGRSNSPTTSSDGGTKADTPDSPDTGTTRPTSGANNGGGESSGGGSTGSTSGGTGTSGTGTGGGITSGGGSSPAAPAAFTASIDGDVAYTSTKLSVPGVACSYTYSFSATVAAQNAPGSVVYKWIRSDGNTSGDTITFSSSEHRSVKSGSWTINQTGDFWMIFRITVVGTDKTSEKKVTFKNTCGSIGIGF